MKHAQKNKENFICSSTDQTSFSDVHDKHKES